MNVVIDRGTVGTDPAVFSFSTSELAVVCGTITRR